MSSEGGAAPALDFDLDVAELRATPSFTRADLTLYGLLHAGSSYVLRIFFHAPDAWPGTACSQEAGYAGGVTLFGHGGCAGEDGHCHPRGPVTTFDRRPPHQLAPATKNLICTEALRRALPAGDLLLVRIVPVLRTSPFVPPDAHANDVLTVPEIAIHTYL